MKKGKLTTKEKYIIQGMNNCNKTIEDIAKELDRSEEIVKNYIDKELNSIVNHIIQAKINQLEQENTNLKQEVTELQTPKPKKVTLNVTDVMGHESVGGRKGVSIMTQAASEQVDASKERNRANTSLSVRDKGKYIQNIK
jgi:hypothetical protein